ncbi:MAG: hypothetical protein AMJ91_06670 [candidate division Zixibacteria bacterium SM23_73_3]|nr:MAG: hypothetical protein AMJ91_06670 [candidate division Zixibacteria bacterium SM23_73_3]
MIFKREKNTIRLKKAKAIKGVSLWVKLTILQDYAEVLAKKNWQYPEGWLTYPLKMLEEENQK